MRLFLTFCISSLVISLAESLRFYDAVGSIGAEDITPAQCYRGTTHFKCKHITACSRYIKYGLDRACARIQSRADSRKAAMAASQAQLDDYRPRVAATSNPYFVRQLENITVTEGETVTLRCSASGNPIPRVAISLKRMYRPIRYVDRYRGYNTGYRDVNTEMTMFAVTEANEGWYRCATTNTHGSHLSDMYLRVQPDPCNNVQCRPLEECVNEDGRARCQCPSPDSCVADSLHPVCGSDCVSYFNPCLLKVQACESGENVTVWQDNAVCPTTYDPSVNQLSNQMRVQAGASLRLKCGAQGVPQPEVAWYQVERSGLKFISKEDMLEVRDVEQDKAGKYVCIATNCMSRSIRTNVVNVDILEMRETERKVCHVFGDPHVTTFNGNFFSFVGNCDYVLAMDCGPAPRWFIYGRVRPCGEKSSCLQSISVIADNHGVQFAQGWVVNNNGTEEIIAPGGEIQISGIGIAYDRDGLIYTITLDRYHMSITWDGYSSATIIASEDVRTCGLCGRYAPSSSNDVERSWFSGYYNNVERVDDNANERIGSWKLDVDEQAQCPRTVAEMGSPLTDTCLDVTVALIVDEECRSVLESEPFSHCMHNDQQLAFYTRACVRDSCGHDSEWAFCEFLESVKQHCEQETQIPVDLRLDQCPDKAGRKIEMIKHFL